MISILKLYLGVIVSMEQLLGYFAAYRSERVSSNNYSLLKRDLTFFEVTGFLLFSH